jgi:hypothetical protein
MVTSVIVGRRAGCLGGAGGCLVLAAAVAAPAYEVGVQLVWEGWMFLPFLLLPLWVTGVKLSSSASISWTGSEDEPLPPRGSKPARVAVAALVCLLCLTCGSTGEGVMRVSKIFRRSRIFANIESAKDELLGCAAARVTGGGMGPNSIGIGSFFFCRGVGGVGWDGVSGSLAACGAWEDSVAALPRGAGEEAGVRFTIREGLILVGMVGLGVVGVEAGTEPETVRFLPAKGVEGAGSPSARETQSPNLWAHAVRYSMPLSFTAAAISASCVAARLSSSLAFHSNHFSSTSKEAAFVAFSVNSFLMVRYQSW